MDESGNSNEIKMIKSTLCFNKNPNDFSDIPLPNFSEKHLNYYQKIQEEHKSMMESDSEIELKNIISAHHKSINDYKNQNNCELVYSEEPINNENINSNSSINVSYEELLDMVNIKEPLDKNASKNYIYKNHNPNNELLFSSNFESGNLRYAIKKNINEYDLILRHETGSIKTYQWFYFRVAVNEFSENYNLLKENPIVKFNIINLYKKHIILNNRVRVLTFYNNAWSRDTSKIYYYTNDIPFLIDSNDNNKCTNKFNTNINESFTNIANNNNFNIYDIIMNMNASKDKDKENNNQNFHTLTFQFDLSKINTDIKYVYFAYCYPYTYTQLTNYLFSLGNYKKILRIDSIGQRLHNNKL